MGDSNTNPMQPKKTSDAPWWQPAILVFVRLSAWIVAPVILGLFIGKWLDRQFNTEPWLFLATTGFAFLISMFGIVKNTITEFKKIEKEAKEKKENELNK